MNKIHYEKIEKYSKEMLDLIPTLDDRKLLEFIAIYLVNVNEKLTKLGSRL